LTPARRAVEVVAILVAGLALTQCSSGGADGGGALRVSGSTTVSPVAADAAEVLRDRGMEVTIDDSGGSAGGLAQLGQGQVDIAMISKPVTDADRAQYPDVDFTEAQVGADAVGVIVRREVADGGLDSITREEAKAVFEGRVTNWSELGGPDIDVFVYDKEPGRGTREALDAWMYDGGEAPPPPTGDRYAVVGGNEEQVTKLSTTPGSVGPLSTAFVAGHPELVALAIDGVEATPENIAEGSYPMARPLYLVTDGPATGDAERFVDYVLSDDGQALVTDHGYLRQDELGLA
jgi:phosphate transport system substrate-binding protein